MGSCGWFLTASVLANALLARTMEIPALAYGPNIWSILRFSNDSESSQSVNVDVYCKDGERLPIGPMFEIEPRKTLDVRIESSDSAESSCWARVVSELDVRASVEVLNGNQLETFDRRPAEASDFATRAVPAREVEDKHLYFANLAETSTVLTFCQAKDSAGNGCQKAGAAVFRMLVKPREAIKLDVKKIEKKYLVIESSRPGLAMAVLFSDDPGRRRFYSTESTIDFGRLSK